MLGKAGPSDLIPPSVLNTAFSLGQDPPPQQQEEVSDGRSLAEVCLAY